MERELYRIFGALLSYPGPDVAQLALRGAALASSEETAGALASFAALAREAGPARMQELYTAAFDLQPLCAPYLGHQLCGEDGRRGRFLVALLALYRQSGFALGEELPDHLSEVLRFLAEAPVSQERDELVRDGLFPAVEKMVEAFAGGENPYGRLIAALWTCLTASPPFAEGASKEVDHA